VFRAIGKTHQEIAEQLGWSVSTVKRRFPQISVKVRSL
jgi:DNA-binding NarL/FixJ family response regulator